MCTYIGDGVFITVRIRRLRVFYEPRSGEDLRVVAFRQLIDLFGFFPAYSLKYGPAIAAIILCS